MTPEQAQALLNDETLVGAVIHYRAAMTTARLLAVMRHDVTEKQLIALHIRQQWAELGMARLCLLLEELEGTMPKYPPNEG